MLQLACVILAISATTTSAQVWSPPSLAVQTDSLEVPDVIGPSVMSRPKKKSWVHRLPAPYVCGTVADAATGRPVADAIVDCADGDSSLRGCSTRTDSLGLFDVAVCTRIMVFSAAGYDTLRVDDWTEIQKPCDVPWTREGCFELWNVLLTSSPRVPPR